VVHDTPYNLFPHAAYSKARASRDLLLAYNVTRPSADRFDALSISPSPDSDLRLELASSKPNLALWHGTRQRADTIFSALRYPASEGFSTGPTLSRPRTVLVLDASRGAEMHAPVLSRIGARTSGDFAIVVVSTASLDVLSFSLGEGKMRIHTLSDKDDPFVEASLPEICVASTDGPRYDEFVESANNLAHSYPPSQAPPDPDFALLGLFVAGQVAAAWGGGVNVVFVTPGDPPRSGVGGQETSAYARQFGGPPAVAPSAPSRSKADVNWRHKSKHAPKPTSLGGSLANFAAGLIASKSWLTCVKYRPSSTPPHTH
jgi:hypothetical protein